jgi:hypothetical protein
MVRRGAAEFNNCAVKDIEIFGPPGVQYSAFQAVLICITDAFSESFPSGAKLHLPTSPTETGRKQTAKTLPARAAQIADSKVPG